MELESAFTGEATHECPHPEWWHAWDEHSVEVETAEFLAALIGLIKPSYCIETGTAFGRAAQVMASQLQVNRHGYMHTLEVDRDRADAAHRLLKGLPAVVINISSMKFLPAANIDFAFFDSGFDLRIPEFLRYREWMHSNTIVAFHDTAPLHGGGQVGEHPDLRTAIERELILPGHLNAFHLPTPRGLTIGRVAG